MKQFFYHLIIISMLIVLGACSEDEMYNNQNYKYNYNKADKMPHYHKVDSCIAMDSCIFKKIK